MKKAYKIISKRQKTNKMTTKTKKEKKMSTTRKLQQQLFIHNMKKFMTSMLMAERKSGHEHAQMPRLATTHTKGV